MTRRMTSFLFPRRFVVECWEALADSVLELAKGSQVAVEGRLRQNEYTDREGNRRIVVVVCLRQKHLVPIWRCARIAHCTAPALLSWWSLNTAALCNQMTPHT